MRFSCRQQATCFCLLVAVTCNSMACASRKRVDVSNSVDSSDVAEADQLNDTKQRLEDESPVTEELVLPVSTPEADAYQVSEEFQLVLDGDTPQLPFTEMCLNKDKQEEDVQFTIDRILQDNESCMEALDRLRTIDVLDLAGIGIRDLRPLAGLRNVTHLILSDNQIVELDALASFTALQSLDLSNNKITSLDKLQDLSKLRVLEAEHNEITDVVNLNKMLMLEELDLQNNQIVSLSGLESLTQLTHLELAGNQISDIKPLAALVKLSRLDLDANQVQDCTALSNLSSLVFLDISHNPLQSVEPLKSLKSLESLYLLGLASLHDLSFFEQIEQLTVHY